MTVQVAVCGPRNCTAEDEHNARRVGQLLAERGATVICGGGTGVMAPRLPVHRHHRTVRSHPAAAILRELMAVAATPAQPLTGLARRAMTAPSLTTRAACTDG